MGRLTPSHDTGDWLDVLPKLVIRAPPAPPAPSVPQQWDTPIVLLGLISATQDRRDALRCTWVRALVRSGGARVLFVVGEGAEDHNRSDVLSTDVGEQLLMRKVAGSTKGTKKAVKIKGVTSYSTYSLYAKTMVFLRHAATQPEPAIVLGDDDIFVQPRALLGYAWALLSAGRRDDSPFGGTNEWYAGRFDWYSWRTETMQATAYWRAMRGALYGAQEWYRNCSPTGAGWVRGGPDGKRVIREAPANSTPPHERCVGPFAFAKGPLVMLSAPVVRWVVASQAFARDMAHVAAIMDGLKPRGKSVERVPQDVQLGYWLSQHPTLRYVALPRKTGWADAFVEVTDLRRLLICHRVPWDQMAWLTSRTQRLWGSARHVGLHLRCAGAPCPPGQCAHARAQVSCAAELLLPDPVVNRSLYDAPARRGGGVSRNTVPPLAMGCSNCQCWEGRGTSRVSAGGACNFSRSYSPQLPQHCCRDDEYA